MGPGSCLKVPVWYVGVGIVSHQLHRVTPTWFESGVGLHQNSNCRKQV